MCLFPSTCSKDVYVPGIVGPSVGTGDTCMFISTADEDVLGSGEGTGDEQSIFVSLGLSGCCEGTFGNPDFCTGVDGSLGGNW